MTDFKTTKILTEGNC